MAEEVLAKATGNNLSISTKYAVEVCSYLRRRKLARAKKILENVIEKKEAIPFKRFTDGVGHRKGLTTGGRYPLKASQEILNLLKSAEANAVNKGLTGELEIVELRANKASSPMRQGRQSRRSMKRTHVYVQLREMPGTRKAEKLPKKTKFTLPEQAKPEKKEAKAEPKAEKKVKEEKSKPAKAEKKPAKEATKKPSQS
jgi:ribosomal protein uL22